MLLGSRVHCFMFFFWQVWKIYTSTESHSGYYFPWSPSRVLFCVSDSSFHDFHHSKNVGNFGGIIYLWDYFQNSCGLYFSLWKKSPEHLSKRNIKNSWSPFYQFIHSKSIFLVIMILMATLDNLYLNILSLIFKISNEQLENYCWNVWRAYW